VPPVPAATWADAAEHRLDTRSLGLLLDNRIAAIRIPGFATAQECRGFAQAARAGRMKYYSVGGRIGYIGLAQYEYRWNRPKGDYFADVPAAQADLRAVLDASFDAVGRLVGLLQSVWPHPVGLAREPEGEYFAGIVRSTCDPIDLHVDWAPLNSPAYDIARIDGQLGWNFFAEELESGGHTTVHNAPWSPQVAPGEIPRSYALDRAIVEGAPRLVYRPTAGDVVLFNSRNPHEVAGGVAGQGSRISVGSFVGRMPDGRLVLWS